jgi:hypothetical protein
MAENNRTVKKKYLTQPNKDAVQKLLDDVENRSFFRDVTEEEYEALSKSEKENGDLYLIIEED